MQHYHKINEKQQSSKNKEKIDNYFERITLAWGQNWVETMGILMPPRAEKAFQRLAHIAELIPQSYAITLFLAQVNTRLNYQGRARSAGNFRHVGASDLQKVLSILKEGMEMEKSLNTVAVLYIYIY